MTDQSNTFYTTGGTVITGIYIERDADRLLFDNCLCGEFSAILTSRQMGKTSLMYRTREKLLKQNIHVTTIDLHLIGETDVEDQWFPSFLSMIADDLELDINVGEWWEDQKHLTPIFRMVTFFYKELVLKKDFPIVIFLDEIEGIRGRSFANDFFAAIRAIYNIREKYPKLQKLSFVLLGCVLPYQLISDSRKTSYNIGNFINLTDFKLDEAMPLIERLTIKPGLENQVMQWIFEWTGGQPYLTQIACNELFKEGKIINHREQVDEAIGKLLKSEEYKGKHLKYLQTWLTDPKSGERVLRAYGFILDNAIVLDHDKNQTLNELKLIGVIKPISGQLYVRNKIYRQSLDRNWVVNELTRGGAALPQDFSRAKAFIEEPIALYDNEVKDEIPDRLTTSIVDSSEETEQVVGMELFIDSIIGSTLSLPTNRGSVNDTGTENIFSKNHEEQDLIKVSNYNQKSRDTRARFLIRSEIPIKNREFFLLALILLVVPIVLSYIFNLGFIIGGLLGGTGLICLLLFVSRKQSLRLAEFNHQLPAMLNLMVNDVRAGYSTLQAMEAISNDLQPPISDEFRRVVQEMQLGIPMQEALDNLHNRIPSDYLGLVITAINIQREVGGNLAEILDTIAYTIRENLRIKGEIRILENLPFWFYFASIVLLTVMQWIIFPGYFELFWDHPIGRVSMGLAYLGLSIIMIIIGISSQRMDLLFKQTGNYTGRSRDKQIFIDFFVSGLILLFAVLIGVPWYIQIWLTLLFFTRYWLGSLFSIICFGIVIYQIAFLSIFNYYELLTSIRIKIELWASLFNKLLFSASDSNGSTFSIWFVVIYFLIILGLLSITIFKNHHIKIEDQYLLTKLKDLTVKDEPIDLDRIELSLPIKDRFLDPGINSIKIFLSQFSLRKIFKSTARRIYQANLPSLFTPWVIFVFQLLTPTFLIIALQYAFSQMHSQWPISLRAILIAITLFTGIMLPQIWLTFRIKTQKSQLLEEFPNALDLLTVCVEAGMSFDSAIAKVCEKWASRFSSIFTEVIKEIQLGKLRREVLMSLAEKLSTAEISSFVAAVVQSEQLGVSMARVLRIESDQIRIKRRQQIEFEAKTIQTAKQFFIIILMVPIILLWFVAPILSRIISLGYK